MKKYNTLNNAAKLTALICLLAILLTPIVIVNAGEGGILMKFGPVQHQVLGGGIHLIIPIVNTVKKISIRINKQTISAEGASKDAESVFMDLALNWHSKPEAANHIFQQIGEEQRYN
jgi:regulator of protease activity HflC (stomatin/prohibitin superfamily)